MRLFMFNRMKKIREAIQNDDAKQIWGRVVPKNGKENYDLCALAIQNGASKALRPLLEEGGCDYLPGGYKATKRKLIKLALSSPNAASSLSVMYDINKENIFSR